ncbi:hypothetical protein ACWEOO_20185 [Kribbella sp. NPDC004138]
MKRRSTFACLAGTVALTAATFVPTAHAAPQAATEACTLGLGSVDAAGAQTSAGVTAGMPPTMKGPTAVDEPVFPPGKVRLSSTWVTEPNVAGFDRSGYVVQGDALYRYFYNFGFGDAIVSRIGGGWSNFTAFEVSSFDDSARKISHFMAYGLRSDGTLFRWNGGFKRAAQSAPGFSSVKSMALISKTATYDTFLANTRGGALYTIRIPITSPLKPIVTRVRTSTWQGFEALVADKCGNYGTLLLGIDKDTKSGYLYAVGHANGTATVINALGKVDGTFPNAPYYRWGVVPYLDPLNGD